MSDGNADLKGLPVFFGKTGQLDFTRIPNFLIDAMMVRGRGIPASFWKLTWIVWRRIMTPSGKNEAGDWVNDYTFKTTAAAMSERYGISPRNYIDWTLAYKLSGLFDISYGRRDAKDVPGTPTVWRYRKGSTWEDWAAFIIGLKQALDEVRRRHIAHGGYHWVDIGEPIIDAKNGFAMCIGLSIANVRRSLKLPSIHQDWIDRMVKAGLAKRDEDGVTYTFVKRSLAGVNSQPKHEMAF